jgi:hypothetical protein
MRPPLHPPLRPPLQVDEMLDEYAGREADLFAGLEHKFQMEVRGHRHPSPLAPKRGNVFIIVR